LADKFCVTLSHTTHCVKRISHEYVIAHTLSGIGYFHVLSENNSRDFLIFETSLTLLLSLACAEYHCSDKNAIVHKIASIIITTISSTRVNALF
jgi:hypothetical protein